MSGRVDNTARLEELRAAYPDKFFFSDETPAAEMTWYMSGQGWLPEGARVASVSLAGEVFNMNCTLRLGIEQQQQEQQEQPPLPHTSLVVKQSRPFIERYPSIDAPPERVEAETTFFKACAGLNTESGHGSLVPDVVGYDSRSKILCMSDVGRGDWSIVYATPPPPTPGCEAPPLLGTDVAAALGTFLSQVHGVRAPPAAEPGSAAPTPPCSLAQLSDGNNSGLRDLTWQFCFLLPLEEGGGGVDLESVTPGLLDVASTLRDDVDFKAEVRRLGEAYVLQRGPGAMDPQSRVLVHGDFFPASWMLGSGGKPVRVIDAEFCHFGLAELDVGFALAHLLITGLGGSATTLYSAYAAAVKGGGGPPTFNPDLVAQMCGVEIMRRLIGIAQLPLKPPHSSLENKKAMLGLARRCVMSPGSVTLDDLEGVLRQGGEC